MSQQSPLPKFGDWDSNNQSFTLIFDNARVGKSLKKINPNDPAFYASFKDSNQEHPSEGKLENSPSELKAQEAPSPRSNAVSTRAYNRKDHDYITSFPRSLQAGMKTSRNGAEPPQHKIHSSSDEPTDHSASSGSTESPLWSGVSSPGNRMQTERQQHRLSAQMSSPGDNGVKEHQRPPQSPSHYQQAYQRRLGNRAEMPSPARKLPVEAEIPAALPKFGSWDANNDASPAGYAAIFRTSLHPEMPGRKSTATKDSPGPQPKKPSKKLGGCCWMASAVKE